MATTDRAALVRRNHRNAFVITFVGAALLWLLITIIVLPIGLFFDHHFVRASAYVGLITAGFTTLIVAINLHAAPTHVLDRIGSEPFDRTRDHELADLFAELAIAAGLPRVHAAVIDDHAPNAIAIGTSPNNTTIAVTRGLLEQLTRDEAAAVIATELAAVALHEVALGTVAMTCLGQTVDVSNGLLDLDPDGPGLLACMLALPFRCVSIVLERIVAIERTRGADLYAVEITRNPAALISAMQKMRTHPMDVVRVAATESDLWFSYPRPVHGRDRGEGLHVTLSERIVALEQTCGVSAGSPTGE
jgi:heat shock protein HtpX